MADYEHLIAQLKSITDDPTKLDGDTQKRILEATKSCSAKLRTRPPIEQLGVLNESSVQTIDPLLLQDSVTTPLECDSLPGNHEAPTNDPRTVGFNQQSTETLSPSSGLYHIPLNLESLDYSSMELSFDPQQVQDSQASNIFNDSSSNWSTSFPDISPYMAGLVSSSLLNNSNQAPDLMDTAYDPLPLDLTTNTYNDFDDTFPLGFPTETKIGPVNMDQRLTTNTLGSVHNASYWNDIGQNAWRLASSPMDQSHAGFNQLPHWPTRSSANIIIDPLILEEPTERDPFSLREGLPTPGDYQRRALQGRTTPDVNLDPCNINTAPNHLVVSVGASCDLPRDGQQDLGRELRATNPSSLSVHSVVSKTIQKPNTSSSHRKPNSQEERRKIAERRRIGACYLCSRGRLKVSLISYHQSCILLKQPSL